MQRLEKEQLINWFRAGEKSRDLWKIGTEHEKFVFHDFGWFLAPFGSTLETFGHHFGMHFGSILGPLGLNFSIFFGVKLLMFF